MNAGKLRHRVEIQSADATADALNQVVITEDDWTTSATRWASITPMSSREIEHLSAIYRDVSHKIYLRHVEIAPDQRIKYGDRIFNVVSVINIDERNKEIEVIATEVI